MSNAADSEVRQGSTIDSQFAKMEVFDNFTTVGFVEKNMGGKFLTEAN